MVVYKKYVEDLEKQSNAEWQEDSVESSPLYRMMDNMETME